jgi:hypothetical protein
VKLQRAPAIYKASWSRDGVEHFIYLGTDIKQHRYLVGEFGFRAAAAQAFGIEAILNYGHRNLRLVRWRDPVNADIECSMMFSFSRFDLARKQIPPRIAVAGMEAQDMAAMVKTYIADRLLPVVSPIKTLESLLDILAKNLEPCPWFAVNRMMRAAQIVAIGRHLDLPRDEIRELLKPYDRLISIELPDQAADPQSCVSKYLDQLISDWTAMQEGRPYRGAV